MRKHPADVVARLQALGPERVAISVITAIELRQLGVGMRDRESLAYHGASFGHSQSASATLHPRRQASKASASSKHVSGVQLRLDGTVPVWQPTVISIA